MCLIRQTVNLFIGILMLINVLGALFCFILTSRDPSLPIRIIGYTMSGVLVGAALLLWKGME